jgi:hypothetical protein
MDARAYAGFIDEIRTQIRSSSLPVPFHFVSSDVRLCSEAFAAFADFAGQMTATEGDNAELCVPAVLRASGRNLFGELLADLHTAIGVAIADPASISDTRRRNITELCRILVDCACPQRTWVGDDDEAVLPALVTFAMEACMHFGWCPSALEDRGKRAAHLSFALMKKALVTADTPVRATAFCYVWGAWLFAQKTEGVKDRLLEVENGATVQREYLWQTAEGIRSYLLYHSPKPQTSYLLQRSTAHGPQPFRRLRFAEDAGMTISVGGKPLVSRSLPVVRTIHRHSMDGYHFVGTWGLPDGGDLVDWKTVVLSFQQTLYRIDVLKPMGQSDVEISQVNLTMESCAPLSVVGNGRFQGGTTRERCVVEFVSNPFDLALSPAPTPCQGLAVFASTQDPILVAKPVQSVIAWASGPGITDIDRTHLLGIHDMD